MIEWKSVKDELPEDRDSIFCDNYKKYLVIDGNGYIWTSELHYYDEHSPITHWAYYNLPNGNHPKDI